jgi:hypothetical protein
MKKRIFKALILALLSAPLHGMAGTVAPLCNEIFDSSRALVRHRESVAGTPARDRLNEREVDLMLELKQSLNLNLESLYERYNRLVSFTNLEIAIAAPPEKLIRIAATSLKVGATLETTKDTINQMLIKAGRNLAVPEGSLGQIKVPHRILLSLAEASLRTQRDAEEVAAMFNEHLLSVREQSIDPAALLAIPVVDVALEHTVNDLKLAHLGTDDK